MQEEYHLGTRLWVTVYSHDTASLFFQLVLACYKEFEERVGVMDDSGVKSSAYDIVKAYADNKLGKFTAADVLANCPGVGRTSAFNALKKLTEEEYIEKHGERQNAFYVKKSTGIW